MAFAATADNPAAIYYNPAGITQLRATICARGFMAFISTRSYKNPTTGQTFDNQFKYHAIPQFYYTYSQRTGRSVLASASIRRSAWASSGRRTPDFERVATEGKLFTETINPVVAFKLFPSLSVGGGVMVNYAKT